MTAAEDLYRRQEAETMLKRLLSGRQYTRKGLFSRIERWQESLLRRLTNSGMMIVTNHGRGKATLYEMKDDVMLQGLLEDEDALLQMVFPSYKPAADLSQTPMLPGLGETPQRAPSEPVTVDTESLEQALVSSDVMSPEILLRLLLGMIELLNSQTDQLNKLSEKVGALDEKVTRLLRELTG